MAAPPSQPSPSNQPVLDDQKQNHHPRTAVSGDGSPTNSPFVMPKEKQIDAENKEDSDVRAAIASNTSSISGEEPSYSDSENSQWYLSGKSMLEDGDFEAALMMIEDGINATKEKLVVKCSMSENEAMMHEAMAPLHYLYGTTLLYSIEESDENQAMTVGGQPPIAAPPSDDEEEPELVETSDAAVASAIDESNELEDDEDEEQDEEAPQPADDTTEDMQIAWENLDLSRTIIESMLQQTEPNSLDAVFANKLKQDLAQVYLREGDLQRTNGKYENAIADYDKTLELLLAAHGPERKIAEVHYNLGLTNFTFVASTKASSSATGEEDSDEQQQQQQNEDPAKLQEKLIFARGRGFYHYAQCVMTFGSILVGYCGLDPHDVLSKLESDLPANKKCSGDENEPLMEDPKMASVKVNRIREFVSKLTPNAEFKTKYDDFVSVLDEIQETIDEAEASEEGVKEVTAMKEQISAAVAAGMGDGDMTATNNSESTVPTTTIGFGNATITTTTTSTWNIIGGVESQPTATNILTAVRKKPKKREAPAETEDVDPSKRSKSE